MVFNENKSAGDLIRSQDWDDFVDFTELISGVAYDIYHSGSKYTSSYNWFFESAQKLSERLGSIVGSGNEYSSAYASAQRVIDSFNSTLYATSASCVSKFAISSNYTGHSSNSFIHKRSNSGYAYIEDGETIIHDLGVLPTYINVTSSGSVGFGISHRFNDTFITVNISSPPFAKRHVFWIASE